ncbi:MAG TPA: hemerythrin domain-containing protein [Hydrogenophilus thermoluteolus]|nr:hemerythrin domain-containing protein [Hydrogenophilus thermoluteolus]
MFEFLFRRKRTGQMQPKQSEPQDQGVAPGTHLRYDPSLVPSLIADHRKLLEIFDKVGEALKQKDSGLLKERLEEFEDVLRGHLLTESVRLYVYLQHSLQGDEWNAALINDLRREMQHIGKAVIDYLQKYRETFEWNDIVWENFAAESAKIGNVLAKRIQTEESVLYPLYLPPEDYR